MLIPIRYTNQQGVEGLVKLTGDELTRSQKMTPEDKAAFFESKVAGGNFNPIPSTTRTSPSTTSEAQSGSKTLALRRCGYFVARKCAKGFSKLLTIVGLVSFVGLCIPMVAFKDDLEKGGIQGFIANLVHLPFYILDAAIALHDKANKDLRTTEDRQLRKQEAEKESELPLVQEQSPFKDEPAPAPAPAKPAPQEAPTPLAPKAAPPQPPTPAPQAAKTAAPAAAPAPKAAPAQPQKPLSDAQVAAAVKALPKWEPDRAQNETKAFKEKNERNSNTLTGSNLITNLEKSIKDYSSKICFFPAEEEAKAIEILSAAREKLGHLKMDYLRQQEAYKAAQQTNI